MRRFIGAAGITSRPCYQQATSPQFTPNKLMPPLLEKKQTPSHARPPLPLILLTLLSRRAASATRAPSPPRPRLPSLYLSFSLSTSLSRRGGTPAWPQRGHLHVRTAWAAAPLVCAAAAPTGPVVAASCHDAAPASPAASRGAWLPPGVACSLRSSQRLKSGATR